MLPKMGLELGRVGGQGMGSCESLRESAGHDPGACAPAQGLFLWLALCEVSQPH